MIKNDIGHLVHEGFNDVNLHFNLKFRGLGNYKTNIKELSQYAR